MTAKLQIADGKIKTPLDPSDSPVEGREDTTGEASTP